MLIFAKKHVALQNNLFNMKKHLFLLMLLSGLLSFVSCSKYQKLLKTNDYVLMYEKSFEYYNKGNYSRATELFDRIASVYKGTEKGDSTAFFQAMSYFKQDDFLNGAFHFDSFYKTFPYSHFAEEALFMSGYCLYKISPKPELDQNQTMEAIEVLVEFMRKFPSSKYVAAAHGYISVLQDKLVEKSYMSAKLYYDLGDYKASATSLVIALNEYPETIYREEMMFMTLKSKFLYAQKSIEEKKKERFQDALDEYMSFAAEYPESDYNKEAQSIYDVAVLYVPSEELLKK